MIEIKDITFSYGDKPIFNAFSLAIGASVCITGPSGCGKSTLLRLIAGLEKPQGGAITGVPEKVTFLFQEDRLLPWATARDNVAAVLPRMKRGSAMSWLAAVELTEQAESLPGALSGGQQRRVALARALAYGGGLLILDEPFKGLDPALTRRIASLIHTVQIPVIATLHQPEEIALLGFDVISLA
ncbi:ABC transporter ATP-binding protein [Oscillospiraceae bacterium CM]|nr:ABC transporter ATP-binding protein [Oscillospiraceae bacterium CM]